MLIFCQVVSIRRQGRYFGNASSLLLLQGLLSTDWLHHYLLPDTENYTPHTHHGFDVQTCIWQLMWTRQKNNTCRDSHTTTDQQSPLCWHVYKSPRYKLTNITHKHNQSVFLKNRSVYITDLTAADYAIKSNYGSPSVRVWICSLQRVSELLSLSCGAASTFNKISFHRNEMCVHFLWA